MSKGKLTLAALVCAGYLSFSSFGCNGNSSSTNTTGSNFTGECYSDASCPGEQMCEDSTCVEPAYSSLKDSPLLVVRQFAKVLATNDSTNGNAEKSLMYIDPSMRETYRARFESGSYNLNGIGYILGEGVQSLSDQNCSPSGNPKRKVCNYICRSCGGDELPIILYKEDDGWKIHGF